MSSEGKNEFKNNKKSKKNVKSWVQSLEFYITERDWAVMVPKRLDRQRYQTSRESRCIAER